MKKTVIFLLCVCLLLGMPPLPICAARRGESWYCKHVKGNVQPGAPSELAFCEDYGAYYIDHRHSDFSSDEKVIYLTFDAGYENGNVGKILDILGKESVTAAFFILSNLIKREPALVKRMAEEGHTVCNHTARHKDMTQFDDASFQAELETLEAAYKECTGKVLARFYRPPEGRFSRENLACAQKMGYRTVLWSFAYPDWDNQKQMPKARALRIIRENLHNGEVMLLHPTSQTNAALLEELIRTLKNEGWRFGTLDELVGQEG